MMKINPPIDITFTIVTTYTPDGKIVIKIIDTPDIFIDKTTKIWYNIVGWKNI